MHYDCGGTEVFPWAAVYGKSAAEDLEDQLRFEEGDDGPDALAHDPLTIISQPMPPIVVPPPPSAPPPAVPAPQLTAAEAEAAIAAQAPRIIGATGQPADTGAESVQPQPADVPKPDSAQAAAEPAVAVTADSSALVQQQHAPDTAVATAAADAQAATSQQPAVAGPAAGSAPTSGTAKPLPPEPAQRDAPAGTVAADAVPSRRGALLNSSNVRVAGSSGVIVAPATAAAALGPIATVAGSAAPLVPQIVPAKQLGSEPRLLTLDAEDKQLQLQLQSSRLGKSVYDLLVQVCPVCMAWQYVAAAA